MCAMYMLLGMCVCMLRVCGIYVCVPYAGMYDLYVCFACIYARMCVRLRYVCSIRYVCMLCLYVMYGCALCLLCVCVSL